MYGRTHLAPVWIFLLLPATTLALPHPVPFEYFPMHEGDLWVYVMADDAPLPQPGPGTRSFEVRAGDPFDVGGCSGCCMRNYGYPFVTCDLELFNDDRGRTCEHRDGRAVGVWYPWTEPHHGIVLPLGDKPLECLAGTTGELEHGCTGLVTRTVAVPAGTFGGVATVRYDVSRAPCQDNALVSESFAPGVGLIAREIVTLAGTERWVLAYAILNGQPIGDPGAWSARSEPPSQSSVGPSSWGAIKATFKQ